MSTDTLPPSSGGTPQSTGTVQSTGSTGTPASTAAAMMGWGDDWRDRLAAGSTDREKELAQLARYSTPEDVWRKARNLEQRLSSGEFKSALKPGASQDEIARWRSENGVPAEPTGYKVNMPQGHTLEEDDKPFVEAFAKAAHEANYTQPQFDRAMAAFYGEVDRQELALGEAEKLAVKKGDDTLREKWGSDYTLNKNMAEAFLDRAPAGFRDRFWNGYLADHMPIRAAPEMWEWMASVEREINPAATVLPGQSVNLGQTVQAELDTLKDLMRNPNSKYYKGAEAEKLQARYRELIAARDKMKAKAA